MNALIEFLCTLGTAYNDSMRQHAIQRYLETLPEEERFWALRLMFDEPRLSRIVPQKKLKSWVVDATGISMWLYDASHKAVREHTETAALLWDDCTEPTTEGLSHWLGQRLPALKGQSDAIKRTLAIEAWNQMDYRQRLIWNQWLAGTFKTAFGKNEHGKPALSQTLIVAALSTMTGVAQPTLAHRLYDGWLHDPSKALWQTLANNNTDDTKHSIPFSFSSAENLQNNPQDLGDTAQWITEWQWQGLRVQLIRRSGETFIWTRQHQLITRRFPEIADLGPHLPNGTVIDGELVAWHKGPLPIEALQKRHSTPRPTPQQRSDSPTVMMAFDLLEHAHEDVRQRPLEWRREQLRTLLSTIETKTRVGVSPAISAPDWDGITSAHQMCRTRGTAGLILKRRDSIYTENAAWHVWPSKRLKAQAVLLYARKTKRSKRFIDCTFGVWSHGNLVPMTSATLAALPESEIEAIETYVRANTIEKFGPARAVKPGLVFHLEFQTVEQSSRHRSGILVRAPKVICWCQQAAINEADHLRTIRNLIV